MITQELEKYPDYNYETGEFIPSIQRPAVIAYFKTALELANFCQRLGEEYNENHDFHLSIISVEECSEEEFEIASLHDLHYI